MNKTYRLKFSKALQQFVAVSEISKGHSRNSGQSQKAKLVKVLQPSLLASLITLSLSSNVFANGLQGMEVISGSAKMEKNGAITTITNSPDAILNWKTFDIAKEETVHFAQEHDKSTAFNRVVGDQASQLNGKLTSNGNVFLINPNGIVIGKDAVIDTNGFVASTLNAANEELKNKNFTLSTKSNNNASVTNHGKIKVSKNNTAALIGNRVQNNGIIEAKEGKVLLQAGYNVTLSDAINPTITYSVSNTGNDVINLGDIISNNITLKANNISNSGNVRISEVLDDEGSIIINATNFEHIGKLDAKTEKNKRNTIRINSSSSNIDGVIDISGRNGGGDVILGGNVNLTENSTIDTSAIETGNAGNITVSNLKQFSGKIKATGGNVSGDGGYIDVGYLPMNISKEININISSPKGNYGGVILKNIDGIIPDDKQDYYDYHCLRKGSSKCISLTAFEQTPNLILKDSKIRSSYYYRKGSINRIGNLTLDNSSLAIPLNITNGNLNILNNSNVQSKFYSFNLDSLNIHDSNMSVSFNSSIQVEKLNITNSNVSLEIDRQSNASAKIVNLDNSIFKAYNISVDDIISDNSNITLSSIPKINKIIQNSGYVSISGGSDNPINIDTINVTNGVFRSPAIANIDNITLHNSFFSGYRNDSLSNMTTKAKSISAHNSYIENIKADNLIFTKDKYIENLNLTSDGCPYNFAEYYCLSNVITKNAEISGTKLETIDYIKINPSNMRNYKLSNNTIQNDGDIALNVLNATDSPDIILKANGNITQGRFISKNGNIKIIANEIGDNENTVDVRADGDIEILSYGNASVYVFDANGDGNSVRKKVGNRYIYAHNDLSLSAPSLSVSNYEITARRLINPYIARRYPPSPSNFKIKSQEIPYNLQFWGANNIDIYSSSINNTGGSRFLVADNRIRIYGKWIETMGDDTSYTGANDLYIFDESISESERNAILARYPKIPNFCVNGLCRDGSTIEDSGFGEMKEITDPFYQEPTPTVVPEEPVLEDMPTEEILPEEIPTAEISPEAPVSEEILAEEQVKEDISTETIVPEKPSAEEQISEEISVKEQEPKEIVATVSEEIVVKEPEWIIPRLDVDGVANKDKAHDSIKLEREFYDQVQKIGDKTERNEVIKVQKDYDDQIRKLNVEYAKLKGKLDAYENSSKYHDREEYQKNVKFVMDSSKVGYQATAGAVEGGIAGAIKGAAIESVSIIADSEILDGLILAKNLHDALDGGWVSFVTTTTGFKIKALEKDINNSLEITKVSDRTTGQGYFSRTAYEKEYADAYNNAYKEARDEIMKDREEHSSWFNRVFNSSGLVTKHKNKAEEYRSKLNEHTKKTGKTVDERNNEIKNKIKQQ